MNNKTFGVIGVCGANGNLIARILNERGYSVIGTDLSSREDCRFIKALGDYDIEVYYGGTPDEFFEKSDYIVPPLSLSEKSAVYENNSIMKLTQLIDEIRPDKPVFAITGTNGKTTSTTLLKKIAYDNNIKPAEHDLEEMQGNAEYIPILQSRLDGDVAVLEVGTFGVPGSIERIIENSDVLAGLITNITPDHLCDCGNFMNYAHVKGEFIKRLENKQLIVNGQDPTIMGLLKEYDYQGQVITFGIDASISDVKAKECVCGREINVKEIISGCGYYFCRCGLTTPQVDYIATNIDLENKTFHLHTPTEKLEVKMSITGLHNVYNITGVIIAAHEFLNLPYDKILKSVETFTGVEGRMEKIKTLENKEIYVDFAHNPASVQTILTEFKRLYGNFVTVITISSESGYAGDLEIFENVLNYSRYIVPASSSSQKIAADMLSKDETLSGRIFLDSVDDFEKEGTLGASYDEVKKGIAKALEIDCSTVLAIGEAACKFKSCICELK